MKNNYLLLATTAVAALGLSGVQSVAQSMDVAATDPSVGAATAPAKSAKSKSQKVAAAPVATKATPVKTTPAPIPAAVSSDRAEIEALRKQVKELADQLNDVRLLTASKINKLENDAQEGLAGRVQGKGVAFTYANGRPTLSTQDGNFSMAFRSRIQFDSGKYFQDANLGSIPVTATTVPITGAAGRLATGAFFRRVFFGVEGRFMKDWEYEIRVNGGSTGTEQAVALDNIRLGYRGFDHFLFEAGAWDIGFTMDQATSSADGYFLERSSPQTLAVGTFGAGAARKAVGFRYFRDVNKDETAKTADSVFAMAFISGDNIANPNSVSAFTNVTNPTNGVVTAVPNPAADGTLAGGVDQSVNLLTRIGYRLVPNPDTAFTFEGDYAKIISPKSFVASTLPGSAVKGGLVTFSDRPEFRGDPTALITTGAIPIKSADTWVIGATGQYKNYTLVSNYYHYSMERDEFVLPVNTALAGSSANPDFEGYDITGSWIITGERRGFNKELFGIGGVSPSSPFSMKGGTGAFEAVARYSVLDLNYNAGNAGTAAVGGTARNVGGNGATTIVAPTPTDGRIRGGRQDITSLGMNWYPNSNVKFQVQYEIVSVDKLNAAGQQAGQDLNILAARMQFAF